jgi:hypothetical protein
MASSLAADPLRPSAERAKSDAVTSDALCHAATPVRDLQPVTWRARPARRPCCTLPHQDSFPCHLVRAAGHVAQSAFHRMDARHRCRTGLACICVRSCSRARHPSCPGRACSAVTQERPTRAIRRCYRRLATTLAPPKRCLSPTSATDPQHEHSTNRWTPCLLRLAASSARVEVRLTPSLQLQPRSRRSSSLDNEERSAGPDRRCAAVGLFGRPGRSEHDL